MSKEKSTSDILKAYNLPKVVSSELSLFLTDIGNWSYFVPDGKPNANWKVFYGSTLFEARYGAWDAAQADMGETWDEKGVATLQVTFAAVRKTNRTIATDFVGRVAWDNAVRAALSAINRIVGPDQLDGAAFEAANRIANDAGSAAALRAGYLLVKDLNFPENEECERDSRERIEALKKGYGVVANVKGTLYVYCVGKPPEGIVLRE